MKEVDIFVYPDGRLDTANAAKYLALSVKTLAMWRCNGTSPEFIKRGNRVFYYQRDLDEWLNATETFTSTAQVRAKRGEE